MRLKQIALIATSFLIFTGCLDQNSPPVYEDVEGVVISQGEPLAGAAVHIRNHFDPGGFVEGGGGDTLTVSFPLQSRDLITGRLYKNGSSEPYATFIDDSLSSGNRTVIIPDSLLINGILAYEITSSTRLLASSLFVVNKPDSVLPGILPFTQTDSNGEFILDIDATSIGQSFRSSGGGFEVTDSLKIIITEGDSVLGEERVRVLPDQSNYFEITID